MGCARQYLQIMDLTYPPETEAFRKEIRSWLEENLPPRWGTRTPP